MTRSRLRLRWLEVFAIGSVLATAVAVFIPTFIRGLDPDRIAEAPRELARLDRLVRTYYLQSEGYDESGNPVHSCVPKNATTRNTRQSNADAGTSEEPQTWKDLGFDTTAALHYDYSIRSTRVGCGDKVKGSVVTLQAQADLDKDGHRSSFQRFVRISKDGRLLPPGELRVKDRVE